MKRIFCMFLMLVFLLTPGMGVIAETSQEQDIKQNINSYFKLKYAALSMLKLQGGITDFLAPEILNSKDVINEVDVLETAIKVRKAQINDLSFSRYNYKLAYKSVKVDGELAYVTFNESWELYFKCAPTVKNSSVVEHIMTLKNFNGKWLILSDDYIDLEGIKKKLNKYFIESNSSKEEAKEKVLKESENQANIRMSELKTIMGSLKDNKLFVFYLGKNIAYSYEQIESIDSNKNITPTEINGKTCLPLKYISEKLGYKLEQGKEALTLKISGNNHNIITKIGQKEILVDGKKLELNIPPKIVYGRTMISAKDLAKIYVKNLFLDKSGLIILSDNVFDSKKNAALVNKLIDFFNVLFTREEFPRIDGSTATYPFSIELGKTLLGLDDTSAKGFITHKTTHNAYVNLINRTADLIFVTEPSEDELQLAKKSGVELDVVPFCKEGFVFLVNKDNKMENLTSKQIKDIYQGKIKNWKEVGGENKEIIPYQREANSGSQTLMENIVMKSLKLMQPPKETVVYGMGELIDRVADFSSAQNALGYSVYYYATTMYQSRNVRLLNIDGIQPNKQTIKNSKYPFITSYYAVLRKDEPKDSNTRRLLKWVISNEGQGVVDKAGFVAIK